MRIKIFLGFILCLSLTSCLELTDETTINENGSGKYVTTIDMGQLIDMLAAMGGEEFEKKKGEKMDSIINLAEVAKENTSLSKEEKKLLQGGTCRVKMDMEEKVFLVQLNLPFKDLNELKVLENALGEGKLGLSSLMQNAMGKGKEANKESADPEMDKLFSVFNYKIESNQIKRSVDKDKLKILIDDPKMAEIQQGADMGILVNQKTVYKLPRPVKSVDNANAKLSDDRRTITLENNLLEVFSKPDKFNLEIKY